MRTFFALSFILASILVMASISWAAAWQLQNMSKEHREIFLYLPGSKKPQTKIVPPHTSVTIPGTTGLEVVDGKTGQKLVNPQGKNMWITPEGHIRMR